MTARRFPAISILAALAGLAPAAPALADGFASGFYPPVAQTADAGGGSEPYSGALAEASGGVNGPNGASVEDPAVPGAAQEQPGPPGGQPQPPTQPEPDGEPQPPTPPEPPVPTPPQPGPGAALPRTGFGADLLAAIGAALLLGGLALRRSRASAGYRG